MSLRLSIITVTFNAAATLEQTLESVHGQTFRNIEHIIIDGASTDATPEILARWRDRLQVVVSEPDRGIYDAMNKGIALATGEVIGILNSDDVYAHSHVLERAQSAFCDPAVDLCYADLVYVSRQDLGHVVRYWKSAPFRPELLRAAWHPPHPTLFVRRRMYQRHGVFDLRYRAANDVELMWRFFSQQGLRAVYVPEIWVKMRLGGASNRSLAGVWRQNVEGFRAARHNHLPVGNFVGFLARKVRSRVGQFFNRPEAVQARSLAH